MNVETDQSLPTVPSVASGPAACCCPGLQGMARLLGVALIAGLVGYWAASWKTGRDPGWGADLPVIDASAAASDEKFSVATGLVSEDAEGFFVLDHATGILQCRVYSPRFETLNAAYTANVGDLLAAGGKGGSYLMVTGQSDMTRGQRAAQLAPTVVYVLNTATGNFAGFAIPFDRQAAVSGRPQQGVLIPIPALAGTAAVVPTR
jgi:hypothetical protein